MIKRNKGDVVMQQARARYRKKHNLPPGCRVPHLENERTRHVGMVKRDYDALPSSGKDIYLDMAYRNLALEQLLQEATGLTKKTVYNKIACRLRKLTLDPHNGLPPPTTKLIEALKTRQKYKGSRLLCEDAVSFFKINKAVMEVTDGIGASKLD